MHTGEVIVLVHRHRRDKGPIYVRARGYPPGWASVTPEVLWSCGFPRVPGCVVEANADASELCWGNARVYHAIMRHLIRCVATPEERAAYVMSLMSQEENE